MRCAALSEQVTEHKCSQTLSSGTAAVRCGNTNTTCCDTSKARCTYDTYSQAQLDRKCASDRLQASFVSQFASSDTHVPPLSIDSIHLASICAFCTSLVVPRYRRQKYLGTAFI